MTLPILDVKLPIRGFYIFVPWLFVLLHFNLLLHFHLLGRKLHAFDKAAAELEDKNRLAFRERLANVPFVHMLVGRQHDRFLRALLAFMVWITVAALPLLLLLWAQIAFPPFHDPGTTWGQRIAVLLDAGLLLLFWGRIVSSQGAIGWWMQRFDQIRAWAIWGWSWLWARIRKLVRRLPRTLVGLSPPARSGLNGASFILAATIGASATSLLIVTVPDEPWEMWLLSWLPKQWIVQCEEGGSRLERQCFSITAVLFERRGAIFHRNMDLREKVLTLNELSAEDVTWLRTREGGEQRKTLNRALGIDVRDRDLRYADLSASTLVKADLRGTRLQGARIALAQLHGANLWNAHLESAGLSGAWLLGAHLAVAKLQGADLVGAQLHGADLGSAQLQGANLSGARLHGARLQHAHLEGANLDYAYLYGADLVGAHLEGADLRGAAIGGARFDGALLGLTDLRYLNRAPLTEKQSRQFGQAIKSEIENAALRAVTMKRLEAGKKDNLDIVKSANQCLSDEPKPLASCLTEKDVPIYSQALVAYLVENLACNDINIASAIAHRALRRPYTALGVALLKSDCDAVKQLPQGAQEELREMLKKQALDGESNQ